MSDVVVTVKRCPTCEEHKPTTDFGRNRARYDGLNSHCKGCSNARLARYYRDHPELARAKERRWSESHPDASAQRQARYRSNHKELTNAKARKYKIDHPEWTRKVKSDSHLRSRYGLSRIDYEAMRERQGGGCAMCGKPPTEDSALHVDHDHSSGRIRGLLCGPCNAKLGTIEDADFVSRALAYLEETNA